LNFTILLAVLAVGFSACVQIFTDPRITGAFVWKSLLALAIYCLHGAIGFFVMAYLLPWNPSAAAGAVTAIVGWIALGGLGLVRLAPRTREPPRWLMHFGFADIVCVLAIAGGIANVAGLI
jgi:hypothetical protein